MNDFYMPHNEDAEQALLGSMMIRDEVIYDVQGKLSASDFYIPVHGDIFNKIIELNESGATVTPLMVANSFHDHKDLEHIGGKTYFADLANSVVPLANADDYAKIIYEASERRRILTLMSESTVTVMRGDKSIDEIRADIIGQLDSGGTQSGLTKTKRQVAEEALKQIQEKKPCYETGIRKLDMVMHGGLYEGFTYGFAGVEKAGKTTFAHTISDNLNRAGVDHAYVALEMGSSQIEQRNMARAIGVNSMKFLENGADQNLDMQKTIANHIATMRDHTLYLDMPGSTFNQIKSEITRLVAKKKIKGFIIDYWQLIGGAPSGQQATFLYEVAQWFANYSRKHGVWCILFSQLNRDRKVFGSSGLEKACDQLYFIDHAENKWGENGIYLEMKCSRYTPVSHLGSSENPAFYINKKAGPYITDTI